MIESAAWGGGGGEGVGGVRGPIMGSSIKLAPLPSYDMTPFASVSDSPWGTVPSGGWGGGGGGSTPIYSL